MPSDRDPIDLERERARDDERAREQRNSSEQAVSGTGTDVAPSGSVRVSAATEDRRNPAGGSVTYGSPPERHPRPPFKDEQLEGHEEESR